MKSKRYFQNFWKKRKEIPENWLLEDNKEKHRFLLKYILKYSWPEARILELGCGIGQNLALINGRILEAVEINPLFAEKASQYGKVFVCSLERFFKTERKYDLIFGRAIFQHIHPKSEWLFKEVSQSAPVLITMENEKKSNNHKISRNYQSIFEKLGMKQIEANRYNENYILRVFKK